jgi:thiamine-monophosphate kinase
MNKDAWRAGFSPRGASAPLPNNDASASPAQRDSSPARTKVRPPKASSTELDLVEWIRHMAGRDDRLVLGIGDDCAVYRPKPGEDLLFTADQSIEGVHFRADRSAARIGERALARALSDIAAMGGHPRFCLISLAAPRDLEWIKAFFRGLLRMAKRTGVALAGGDLASADRVYCDVTICGAVERGRALRRDGAQPGDSLWVSGRLGKSWERRIEPRLELGRKLVDRATACIDISDGLALDLYRLAKASGVAVQIDRVPLARGATMDRALHGGEDYELLFTLPPARLGPRGTTRIGTILRGRPGEIGFEGRAIDPRGWDHFSFTPGDPRQGEGPA